jgi:hypothetical protein
VWTVCSTECGKGYWKNSESVLVPVEAEVVMSRKSKKLVEGRSHISRGRKLHDLEDSETEEELKRFLHGGTDFDIPEDEEEQVEEDVAHRQYHTEPSETFGSLGHFWIADS